MELTNPLHCFLVDARGQPLGAVSLAQRSRVGRGHAKTFVWFLYATKTGKIVLSAFYSVWVSARISKSIRVAALLFQ